MSSASRLIIAPAVLAAILLTSLPALAADDEDTRVTKARLYLQHGEYGDAILQLVDLLYPVQLERREDVASAREMLAVCYFYRGEADRSRSEFVELLRVAPTHRLDPLIHPPELVSFFDGIRTEISEELARIRKELVAAEEEHKRKVAEAKGKGEVKEKKIYIERHSKKNSLWLSFVPFGAGQFQNGEVSKGAAFLSGQAALLGLNIASYNVVLSLRGSDGRTPPEDESLARGFQVTQMVSLGLLVGLAVWGVVDAYRNYKPFDVETIPIKAPASTGGADEASPTGEGPPETAPPPLVEPVPPAPDGATPKPTTLLFGMRWRF